MAKVAQPERVLDTTEVRKLSQLVEEATRSTREGAKRFVEPAEGTLDRAKSRRHHIIFGRRGSGKSSLLIKAASELTIDRRPIVMVDLEEFKGHTYPDVLISVLIRTLIEFEKWLSTAGINPATKKSFWERLFGSVPKRPALKKQLVSNLTSDLAGLRKELEYLLYSPDEADHATKSESHKDEHANVGGKVSAGGQSLKAEASADAFQGTHISETLETKYRHTKIATLQRNIIRYKNFFSRLAEISGGASFLFLDDLYHIPRRDQAHLIDYFHRIAKGSDVWLKIGTIRHRTRWYVYGDPPIGMKLGDDADEIDLDVTLEKYDLTRKFLLRILDGLCQSAGVQLSDVLAEGARDRLVLASGGVARDFLTIFRRSIDVARERVERKGEQNRGARIGAEDVNLAAGEYDKFKREDFERDTQANDRDRLLGVLAQISKFCLETSNTNCFLLAKDAEGEFVANLHELVDLKFLHQARSRVTVRDEPGRLYEAFMLDLSQYAGERMKRGLDLVEFWKPDAADALRKKKLVLSLAS